MLVIKKEEGGALQDGLRLKKSTLTYLKFFFLTPLLSLIRDVIQLFLGGYFYFDNELIPYFLGQAMEIISTF